MAEDQDDSDKTEDPTAKRILDAIERGDVVTSMEVSTWFMLAAATLLLIAFSGSFSSSLALYLKNLIANAHAVPMDGSGLLWFYQSLGLNILFIMALPFLVLMIAGVLGHLVQHPLVWSVDPITPKASKISPLSGFKRIFGKIALVNFAKGLIKITLVGVVITLVIWPRRNQLEASLLLEPMLLLQMVLDLSLLLMGAVVAVLFIVAAADYAYQYNEWYQRQKMSMRELKEEFRQQEGDPLVKSKLRAIRQERASRRMMAEVPKASVVITNPTHYAIALKYEEGMGAPVCVAKGVDALALKIREVAEEAFVPLVENPPLARALYATVDLDEEIPEEHYKAVAEVIGYVMKLRRRY